MDGSLLTVYNTLTDTQLYLNLYYKALPRSELNSESELYVSETESPILANNIKIIVAFVITYGIGNFNITIIL